MKCKNCGHEIYNDFSLKRWLHRAGDSKMCRKDVMGYECGCVHPEREKEVD